MELVLILAPLTSLYTLGIRLSRMDKPIADVFNKESMFDIKEYETAKDVIGIAITCYYMQICIAPLSTNPFIGEIHVTVDLH